MSYKRYRVLYVQKAGGGGTVTALYELLHGMNRELYEPIVLFYKPSHYVEKFQAYGIQVLVLSDRQPSIADIVLEKHTTAHLAHYGKWLPSAYRTVHAMWLVLQVAFLIKQKGIDLVHHNENLYQDRFTIAAAWLVGVLQVCHMHSFSPLSNFEKRLGRSVNAFLLVSTSVKRHYLEQGLPEKKSHIVYNGFDVARFERVSKEDRARIRAEFQISDSDALLVNAGRFDSWKGQDYFLQAIAQVIPAYPSFKALIVGELTDNAPRNQAYYEKLQTLVKELDLSKNVIFTGFRNDIPQVMAAADVVVHSSSLPEPFGRVIVEGMLAERPVIATAAGGVLDIIQDRETGLLVPPQDATRMAKAILWLLQNPEDATRLGKAAKQLAKTRFSIEHQVETVQQIYQEILE